HLALSSLSGHAHLYVGVSAYRSLSQSKGSVGVGSTSTGSGVVSISHYAFVYSPALFNGHVHGVGQMGCFSIVHLHPPCDLVSLLQVLRAELGDFADLLAGGFSFYKFFSCNGEMNTLFLSQMLGMVLSLEIL
ncbi:MAG: hypothetical protein EZS28_055477, partial [Streblomastix strix]